MSQNSLSSKELEILNDVFDVFGETEDDETPEASTDTVAAPVTSPAVLELSVPASTTPPVASPAVPASPVAASPVTPTVVAASPVAPTVASPAPAVPATGTDAVTDGEQEQRARREPNGYLWLAAGVAAGVAAFVVFQGPNPLGSVQTQALSDPAGAVSATLVDAKAWYAEHGSFTGFTGVEGTDVAAGGPIMIVTAGSGTSCTYAGIAPQHDTVIRSDATGAHCAPERLAALRIDLANL
jgi:hypothetical protein